MPHVYAIFLAVTAVAGVALTTFFNRPQNPREPKHVHGTIPYLSHAIGLIKEKTYYYAKISKRANLPIFTLPLPGTKLYVVCSPQLVMSVQKMANKLAFPPIAAKFAVAMTGCSKEAQDIISLNLTGDQGDWGYSHTVHKTMRAAITPGPKLDDLVRPMLERVSYACDELAKSSPTTINLAEWLRHEVVMATAVAVWGPVNPLQDKKVENAFWEFEDGLYGILFGIMPSVTARSAVRARKICTDAFFEYFDNMRHEQGSELVKARYSTSRHHGVSVRDIAKFEVANIVAVVMNTFPAVFWMLYYVFSHPDVLCELREELSKVVETTPLPDGTHKHIIDFTGIKTACPVLVSTMQETLRLRSIGGSFRLVLEDSILDGEYFLEKGSTVIMPSLVYHSDTASWGNDAEEFKHKRFMNTTRQSRMAFRGFGGGHTLCPGRHFATSEIISLAAMLITRFELVPAGAKGWPPVRTERVKLWAQLTETEPLIDLNVKSRDCWDPKDKWVFGSSDAHAVVRMTAEDRE